MTESHDAWGAPRGDAGPVRLSRWEVLGAWLHVWTPPRDSTVPPIPWKRIGLGAALLAVVVGIAAAIAVPRIDEGKQEGARLDAATAAQRAAAERRRIVADQRPHRGRAARPAGRVTVADRRSLLGTAQAAVLADAKARVEAGTLETPVQDLTCQGIGAPRPEIDPAVRAAAYDCTAITGRIAKGERNAAGALGYPFRLKVDFARFTYVWCKQNPPPGEQVIPDPRQIVPLPPACRL